MLAYRNLTEKKGAWAFLSLALLTIWATGCVMTPDTHGVVSVTETYNNSQVHLTTGETLAIRLPMQGGTGYGWELLNYDVAQLSLLGDSVEADGDQKMGGPQVQIFRLKAIGAGSSDLQIHYLRPWEKILPPVKIFRLKVMISDAGK